MQESITCIDADIYINDDGSMDCPWLEPYFEDMTQEEYKTAGTALKVRRGCGYCYKMLEWKCRLKDENWTEGRPVCHGSHPDWPGEWVSASPIHNSTGELIGYQMQWEFYRTLHDVEKAGWELHWEYFSENERIYRDEKT